MTSRFPVLSYNDYFELVHLIVPPLDAKKHKGQAGRIGIIGGSEEFTGAPYFAGMSALSTGADLVYVFCSSEASIPIKSYSPELIVYPVLDKLEAVDFVSSLMPKLHSLVIGPGLGRKPQLKPVIKGIVEEAKLRNMPLVIDADGLDFVCNDFSLVRGYNHAILTPNEMEYQRLIKSWSTAIKDEKKLHDDSQSPELAKHLGVTILTKGLADVITIGSHEVVCTEAGSGRRCGGQGDILSGALGLAYYWALQTFKNDALKNTSPSILACMFASVLTKRTNRLAFSTHGRSFLTTDMLNFIGKAFDSIVNRAPIP